MGKRLIIFVIVIMFMMTISGSRLIFEYDRCVRNLDRVRFYGSVLTIQEHSNFYRIYMIINTKDVFTVYIDKNLISICQFDALYFGPVSVDARYWNRNYEIYTGNGLRFSSHKNYSRGLKNAE